MKQEIVSAGFLNENHDVFHRRGTIQFRKRRFLRCHGRHRRCPKQMGRCHFCQNLFAGVVVVVVVVVRIDLVDIVNNPTN